jgi:hypothetical protein
VLFRLPVRRELVDRFARDGFLRAALLRPVVFRPVVLRAAVRLRLGLRRTVFLLEVRFRAAGLRVEAFRVVRRRAGRASGIGSDGIPMPIGSWGCSGNIGISSVTLFVDLPFESRIASSCRADACGISRSHVTRK